MNELFQKACRVYGKTRQMMKAAEELAEASAQVSRYLGQAMIENEASEFGGLADELADALIVIQELFGIVEGLENETNQHINYKLSRLRDRLDAEKKKGCFT